MQAELVFRPSNLHRRQVCNGSGHLESLLPQSGTSADATHGISCHDWTYEVLLEEFEKAAKRQEGMTIEDATAVSWAVKQVGRLGYETTAWLTEHPVALYCGLAKVCDGTADLVLIDAENRKAFLFDLKFGRYATPGPSVNLQTASYGAGLLQNTPEVDEVHVALLQPFVSMAKPEVYIITKADAVAANIGGIRTACVAAAGAAPDSLQAPEMAAWSRRYLNIVPSACRYCSAKRICPLMQETQEALVKTDCSGLIPAGDRLDMWDKAVLVEKKMVEIKRRIQQEVAQDAIAGTVTEGFVNIDKKGADKVDIQKLADCLQSWFTPAEILQFCKATIMPLRKAFAENAVKRGNVKTLKEGKQLFASVTTPAVTPGLPTSHIERDKRSAK